MIHFISETIKWCSWPDDKRNLPDHVEEYSLGSHRGGTNE